VVDDGSTDGTRQVITGFASVGVTKSASVAKNGRFCALSNGENRGVGAAIVTGYKKALEEEMDIVVVMAGDNQMDAAHLPQLLEPVVEGKADYAKGNRLSRWGHREGMSNWRLFGNWLLTSLTKIASGYWKTGDPQNGYAAITQEALRRIDLDSLYPRYGYCNDLLVKLNVAGCRVVDVPIPARYGKERSKIKYSKYITTVSPLLLRGFLWRLKMKYFRRQKGEKASH
jgi:glycosyltransferase involved in cell wall biosynthesis